MITGARQYVVPTLALAAVLLSASGCGSSSGGTSGGTVTSIPLAITTNALPAGVQGQSYNFSFQATGGTAPYRWSVISSGGLPSGLQFSTNGVLSGSTNYQGLFSAIYQVQDASSPPRTSSASLSFLIVAPLTIQTTVLTSAGSPPNVGVNYSAIIDARGGVGTYSWSLLAGSGPLPPGLTLGSSNGSISGVPTVAGTYQFTVQVSNAGPPQQSASQSYSLTITNNLVILDSTEYRLAVVTKPFQLTLQALGGQPPYTWGLVGKSQFAPGLSLDPSTGIVSGTPSDVGNFQTLVQITDSSSPQPQSVQATFTIVVNKQLYFYYPTLQDAIVGQNYFATFPVMGGIEPYTAKLVAGSLPAGIVLQSSKSEIAGVSNSAGTSTFTIEVDDSETPPASIQQDFTVRVNPRLSFPFAALPNALVGTPYSYAFQTSGGLPPLHWNLSPYIPITTWLTIDSQTGMISGTPSAAMQNVLTVTVSDSSIPAQSAGNNVSILVLGTLQVTTSALPPVTANTSLNMQLGASGGIGQYTWTITSGAMPTGLTFDPATGTISGQATQTGTSNFSVQVNDAGPPAQTSTPQALQLTVGTNLGRNDSPVTATPLSNGTFQASISPYSDPPNGVANPDSDYYKLSANPGATVTLETQAQRLVPPSPLDSVIEIVDSNGNRLTTCSSISQPGGPFDQPCMNDDIQTGIVTDSKLALQVPPNASGPQTFFAHILDFRGSARPDFVYTLTVTGAN